MIYIDVMTSPYNQNLALDLLISKKTKQKYKGPRAKNTTDCLQDIQGIRL